MVYLSYGAALKHLMAAAFHVAMEKEWANLKAIGAVHVVERPPGVHILPNLWVLNFILDGQAKGHLVLEGSMQILGVDFDMSWQASQSGPQCNASLLKLQGRAAQLL